MSRRLPARIGLFLAIAVAAAACSLPTDESAQIIPQESLAPSLQRVPPPVTSTSVPQVLARQFTYYLLADRPETGGREVRRVDATIEQGSLFDAIDAMDAEGFPERIGAEGVSNVVQQYDVVGVNVVDGIATVSMETLEDIPIPDTQVLQDAAAQLVFTLFEAPDIQGVQILIGGEAQQLPTTPEGYSAYLPVPTDGSTTLPDGDN